MEKEYFYLSNGREIVLDIDVLTKFAEISRYKLCPHFIERALTDTPGKNLEESIINYAHSLRAEDDDFHNAFKEGRVKEGENLLCLETNDVGEILSVERDRKTNKIISSKVVGHL